jgi:hypothetical protein
MKSKSFPVLDDFTLINSGIIYRLVSRLNIGGTSANHLVKRILLLIAITWVPLLLLTAFQGLAFSSRVDIPFWKDFATHARFLIILPLLIFAEGSFDSSLRDITNQFFKSGILDETDLDRFGEIKKKVKSLSESIWPDLIILLVIVLNIIFRLISARANNVSIWIFLPDSTTSSISLAGIYLGIICGPFFQFILLRWFWRWIILCVYFRKLARLPLKLNSAHPDMAGGIGFLGYPPGPFMQVVFALAILFSTAIAEYIFFQHEKLQTYYPLLGAFALLAIMINVMPLLVFIKPLIAQRRKGFFEYSSLIHEHHMLFDEKYFKPDHEPVELGIADPSSVADFNGTFEIVKNMKTIPFDIKIMVSSIVIAILPMLPLLAFEYNVADLVIKVLKMLA